VLKTFQSFKLDSVSVKNLVEKSGRKDEDRFFAKYLTNQNLLQLQMSDSNFRRYIYVQMLILFQYLQSSVKFKQ
jgi:THO complex subunit 1